MTKRLEYQEVKEIVNSNGYELISEEYINNQIPLIIKDNIGYLYQISLSNLKKGKIPPLASKNNPYTIQNIKLWCIKNNKNFELLSDNYIRNYEELKWKCLKEGCEEIFTMSWSCISSGVNCPYCRGHRVGLSNCLATKYPNISEEWHPTKNGELTPYDITAACGKKVWWKCKKNHEWESYVYSRTTTKTDCPYCKGKFPTESYNLLTEKPELSKEWNYKRNKCSPEDFLPTSGKRMWWICLECEHEWKVRIADRNYSKTGCPICNKSKGEKRIKEWMSKTHHEYIHQKEYDGLLGLGNGNLSYDFYLPQYNLLIEYQGEQHERYIKGFHTSIKDFEKQVEHDRRKKEYAENNSIQLLEIWYWDYDNIEKILEDYLYTDCVNI